MEKSVSAYFGVWQFARECWSEYASEIHSEDKADEQFEIQQHAVLMMSQTPSCSRKEVKIKLNVVLDELGLSTKSTDNLTPELQLLLSLLADLESCSYDLTTSTERQFA
ncbi:MAG: hypothetical protein AAF683_00825 [Pseudomonadota bacterium]